MPDLLAEMAVPDGAEAMQFVQLGRMIEGKPGAIKGGMGRLDITLSDTTVGEGTDERTQLHTESTRTITTVRLGEVVKLRWGKGSTGRSSVGAEGGWPCRRSPQSVPRRRTPTR